MASDQTHPFRWNIRDPEGEAIAVRMSARQGDTALTRAGNWLLYALGSVFIGEHLWNFFRYYGELDGARSTGAEYGAALFMFLFAALIPITIAAMNRHLGANVAGVVAAQEARVVPRYTIRQLQDEIEALKRTVK